MRALSKSRGDRRDPTYDDLRSRVHSAVCKYRSQTYIVEDFLKEHGVDPTGWSNWDIAPFHVLNIRKGEAIPPMILEALDAAIKGREAVSDEFTVANVDPGIVMDAADIRHRIFVEKLRTLRRVWFPNVPERTFTAPTTATTSFLTPQVSLVQISAARESPDTRGPFSALSGAFAGSDFYKVSFETPVELAVVTGGVSRNFEVTPGHVKLTQKKLESTPAIKDPPPAKKHFSSLKQVAVGVTAAVSARVLRSHRKNGPKRNIVTNEKHQESAKRKPSIDQTQRSVRAPKRQRLEDNDPDYNAFESESEDTEATVATESSKSKVPVSVARPLHEQDDQNQGDPAPPVRRSQRLLKQWIVDVGRTGDMTFYNPAGPIPCTYIEEDEAKGMLLDILNNEEPVVVTTRWEGRLCELSRCAVECLAQDKGDSIMDLLPHLVAITNDPTTI